MSGRESAASLSVVPTGALQRLAPSEGLTEAEKAVWLETTMTKPADWFREDSAPLLREYCRSVVMCDQLADEISAAKARGDTKERKDLMALRDMESKRMAAAAVK